MKPSLIDPIVEDLKEILETSKKELSPLGYFPALYLNVTVKVRGLVADGNYFENSERMERMVVNFAGRYIAAWRAHRAGAIMTGSWKIAIDQEKNNSMLVVQHLVLGMNAHINLDLGISASAVAPGKELAGFENDFNKINDVLASMIEDTSKRMGSISPSIGWVDRFLKDKDEWFSGFSLKTARNGAWKFANQISSASDSELETSIRQRDEKIVKIGEKVFPRRWFSRLILAWVRMKESKDIAKNISVLAS